jgi:hypothetical protein
MYQEMEPGMCRALFAPMMEKADWTLTVGEQRIHSDPQGPAANRRGYKAAGKSLAL